MDCRALAHVDAAEVVIQVVREIQRLLSLHVLAVGSLHVRWDLIHGQAEAAQRVLPMTVICGSSWAVAGLLGPSPKVSAANARVGSVATATQTSIRD